MCHTAHDCVDEHSSGYWTARWDLNCRLPNNDEDADARALMPAMTNAAQSFHPAIPHPSSTPKAFRARRDTSQAQRNTATAAGSTRHRTAMSGTITEHCRSDRRMSSARSFPPPRPASDFIVPAATFSTAAKLRHTRGLEVLDGRRQLRVAHQSQPPRDGAAELHISGNHERAVGGAVEAG